jgi:hypothetical protein
VETELELDIRFGVTVVIDVNGIQNIVTELVEIRSARGILKRNEVAD